MNKNLNRLVILISIILLVFGTIFVLFKIKENKMLKNSGILATSKFGNVTNNDVQQYLDNLQQVFNKKIEIDSLKKEEKELIINEIINNRILLKNAKDSGVENSEEFKNKLKTYSENLTKEIYLDKIISASVTEELIKKKYDEVNSALKGKKEYKVKHILVKTKPEILNVIKELKNHTFEELAEKYSIDSSRENGGDLGYVIEGQTVKEFDDVLKKQPRNKLSEPFETQFGWHILIKEDERNATIRDYKTEKESIKMALTRDAIRDLSIRNIENADIKIIK